MMRKILISALLLGLCTTSGCSVYRPTIQQGNILEPEQISKLKSGMSKRQVMFVMGTPLLQDPFHNNRWDYVHTVKPGSRPKMTYQRLTLYFENDTLTRIDDSELQEKILK